MVAQTGNHPMTDSANAHRVASWLSPQVVSIGITGLLAIASFVGMGIHITTHLAGKIDRVRQELSGQIQHINTRIDSLITQQARQ